MNPENIFDEETLRHVISLNRSNDPHWKRFVDFLSVRWQKQLAASGGQTDVTVTRWLQGRAHELADLKLSISSASETEKKMYQPRIPKGAGL